MPDSSVVSSDTEEPQNHSSAASDSTGAMIETAHVSNRGQERILYIGGKEVSVKSVPQCITCQCVERETVEAGYIAHRSYRSIAMSLPRTASLWRDEKAEDGQATVEKVIRRLEDHFQRGHGNIDQTVSRQVMEAIAKAQGVDMDAMGGTIVHEYGVLTEVQRRGFESLLESDKPVPLAATLRATELLLRYKDVAQGTDSGTFQRAIESIFEILRPVLSEEEAQMVFAQMEQSPPIIQALQALTEGGGN